MNLDWILSPLTQYILCSLCLGGSLLLWVSFKKELQLVRVDAKKSYALLHNNVEQLSSSIDTIREFREPLPLPLPSQSSGTGFDLTKRAEVLQMSRRNEPVNSIAESLRLPRNEVELLLKIDRLLAVRS